MDEASFTLLFPAGPEDEADGRELGTTETEHRASRSTFLLLPAMPAVTKKKKTPRPPSCGILHVPEGTGRLHKFRNDIRKVMPSCYAIVIGSGLRNIQYLVLYNL